MINWKTIGEFLKNGIHATLRGEFLLRLRFDRYFLHIIYFFIICTAIIWTNLQIEQTLLKVEQNKAILNDLKIYHAQKTCELVSFDRLSTVQDMLKEKGSQLTIPEKPAYRLKR